MKKFFIYATLLLGLFTFQACGSSDDDPIDPTTPENPDNGDNGQDNPEIKLSEWNDYADASSSYLITAYWSGSNGYFARNHYTTTYAGYWPQAHAMDVVIDAYNRNKELFLTTKNQDYYKKYVKYGEIFDKWYTGIYAKNGNRYENHYFDDMEWIALTMIRLYEATGTTRYLDTAKQLWEAIKTAWSDQLGGGLFWRGYDNAAEKQQKNACSNGPGSLIACRLYANGVNKEENLEWAKKIFEWEKANLVENNGKVIDNIDLSGNKTNWNFTYNQGTYLGTAHELYKITGERSYLMDACLATNYTLTNMTSNGILKKEGSQNGDDAGLFRAVFIRYFVKLALEEDLDSNTKNTYKNFLYTNSSKLWSTARADVKPATYYWNRDWTVSDVPNGNSDPNYDMQNQTSGCTLIEARALYENSINND